MNHAFEIAGIGLSAQQRALDVIANNIANLNTLGFKRSDVRFVELIASAHDASNPSASASLPFTLAGVSVRPMLMLDSQGDIERTGRALDIAIDGEGFIEIMGPRGETLLWRGGAMSVQEDALLATSGGLALRAAIEIPPGARELQIDADGVVRAQLGGDANLTELGRIAIVTVDDPGALERLDGGLYRLADAGLARELVAGEAGAGTLVQGALERSNVELSEEMVRLMLVQRAYAANAQIVQAADQLMAIANNLRK